MCSVHIESTSILTYPCFMWIGPNDFRLLPNEVTVILVETVLNIYGILYIKYLFYIFLLRPRIVQSYSNILEDGTQVESSPYSYY